MWLILFFIIPVLLMAVLSLRPDMRGGLLTLGWIPTLNHYRAVVESSDYMSLLLISGEVAFVVALVGVILAYPLAYFLAFRAGRRSALFLTLLLLPFWTSFLLRIIAWKIILGSNGLINSLLLQIGFIQEPISLLLYSRQAVILTLIYVWLPFVALPIYAALQRIDRSLLEASAILGAPPWFTFLRVTLPLSMPGVIAGFLMIFIPTVGEYVTPLLVGGSRGSLYGNIIQTFFGNGLNWPLGSAMALIMLVGVLVLLSAVVRLIDIRRFLG
jgi:spermidine/putrescine transport system permease protein